MLPEQITPPVPTDVIDGEALTDTATVEVLLQPDTLVPVTVYMVLIAGLAVTDELVLEARPVAGVQLYVPAPDALITVDVPLQIVTPRLTAITGTRLTVTATAAVLWQP